MGDEGKLAMFLFRKYSKIFGMLHIILWTLQNGSIFDAILALKLN